MGVYDDLRNQAKIDSRRFGKSIVARIVHGPLLSLIEQKGLIPNTILINNKTGLDPVNNKMVVIPVTKYDQIFSMLKEYNTVVTEADNRQDDIELYATITRSNETLLNAIKQNMILVTLNASSVPQGILAGADPATYDVIIDSIDVNQAIEATYVFRKRTDIREIAKRWNR